MKNSQLEYELIRILHTNYIFIKKGILIMFDIDNHEKIMELISAKHPDAYVIPIYVQLYHERYGIDELKEVKQFNPAGFRVGFGAKISMFDKHSFPPDKMFAYEIETVFSHFNDKLNTDEKFVVYSTIIVKEEKPTREEYSVTMHPESKINSEAFYNKQSVVHSIVDEQIEYYYNQLKEFLKKQYETIRRQIIDADIAENSIQNENKK
jgi:hypothetical protein